MCASYLGSGCSAFGVGVCDRLGEVLGQVAHRPVRVRARGDDPFDVDLGAEPHHHDRLPVLVEGVECRLPCREWEAGLGIAGDRRLTVPLRQRVDVDGFVELGPPQLQVGRARHRPEHLSRDRTADRRDGCAAPVAVAARSRRNTAPGSPHSDAGSASTGRTVARRMNIASTAALPGSRTARGIPASRRPPRG
jgi:hypothetical protein